jgi:subtilisin family serine protease
MDLETISRSEWLSLAQARDALAAGRGRGVRIAVIDSGIEVDHPRLQGLKLLDDIHIVDSGVQIEVKPGDGTDVFGHGTAVADILRQIAPEVEIGSFRVLGERLASRTVIIREGVRQAIDKGYHILNCSFGCGVRDHIFEYKDWIDEAYLKNIHVVAACNNMDCSIPEWPGYFPTVITVNMATTTEELRFFYKPGQLVEFAARGVDVPVAWRNKETRPVSGSSFATPRVAALLARILSVSGGMDPLEAKAVLHQLADDWTVAIRPSNVTYR